MPHRLHVLNLLLTIGSEPGGSMPSCLTAFMHVSKAIAPGSLSEGSLPGESRTSPAVSHQVSRAFYHDRVHASNYSLKLFYKLCSSHIVSERQISKHVRIILGRGMATARKEIAQNSWLACQGLLTCAYIDHYVRMIFTCTTTLM